MTKEEGGMSNGGSQLTNGAPISGRPRLDPANLEVIDDEMAAVLRAKTPAERVAMIGEAHRTAQRLAGAGVRLLHPDWDDAQVRDEVVRRLLHGTDRTSPLRD